MDEFFPQIIITAVLLVLYPITRVVSSKLIMKYGRVFQLQQSRILKTRQLMKILINSFFFLVIAVVWGVRPGNILVGLSSVFAVIGVAFFAQWSLLSNVTASIILFFYAPYRVGDRVQIIDKDIPVTAVIEDIKSFYTHLCTDEGDHIVIPNNLFLQKMVGIKKNKSATSQPPMD